MNSPEKDLELVMGALGTYRNLVREGGEMSYPPAWSNRVLTAAITGSNFLALEIVPPGHEFINDDAELIDRWGTPLFFHAVSSDSIGVRSAGPDREMYTRDDLEIPAEEKILYVSD